MESFSQSFSLTCTLCSCHFKDPRLLPCRHTFCFSCLKLLCDKATAVVSKKPKITCPTCKVQFNLPPDGAEGFQIDVKTQALKDKIVQEIADNITRSMSSSKDSVPSSNSKFTSGTTNGPNITRPSRLSTQPDLGGSKKTTDSSSNAENTGFSSLYGDLGKYAKYFNASEKPEDVQYKPTIRPDHARMSYEMSVRFRNRRMNSGERDKEEKDFRRRTWYGSTLHSRRTQSLNRASTFDDLDDSILNRESSENLFKISEDREQAPPTEDPPVVSDNRGRSYRDSVFESPRVDSKHGMNTTSTPRQCDDPKGYHGNTSNVFETPKSSMKTDEKLNEDVKSDLYNRRRFKVGGPTRPTLATHRENIPTGSSVRRNSKDGKSTSKSPEHKISFRTRKQSPNKFKEKKSKSPSPSPRKRFNDTPKNFDTTFQDKLGKTENEFENGSDKKDAFSSYANSKLGENNFSGGKTSESGTKFGINEGISYRVREHIDPEKRAKAARDRLSFNFEPKNTNEFVQHPQHQYQQPQQHQPQQQPQQQQQQHQPQSQQQHQQQTRSSRQQQQQQRKARCRSVEPRFSLNKNDFKTDQDFKEHLLGMTMTKDQYDRIMDDFRNGRDKLDSTDGHDNDDFIVDGEVKKTNGDESNEKIDVSQDDKENHHRPSETPNQNVPVETEPPKKPEPLIDENFISSFRTKYSSALEIKRFPNQTMYPDLSEGVTKCWTYQKNDFGVPSAAAFLKSNSLVVADYGESCLEFFDPGGHLEHAVTGMKPFGIASYNNNSNIIVGDRKTKSLRIFDEFGADVSQIDNIGSLEWLSGLAVKKDGGLVMSDRSRCKIVISTIAGEMVKEFGSYGSGPKQLCMADFLTIDSKDRIIVCDSGNHCLKIFDSNGIPIATIGSRGNGDGQFEWPKGVAVDDHDNILVADTMNHRVSLFSADGTFVKHLLTSIPDPYNLTWFNNQFAVLHYNLKGLSQYDVYNYTHI